MRYLTIVVMVALLVAVAPAHILAASSRPTGLDVSWPNCGAKPPAVKSWGMIGATGGLDFKANTCLEKEANWFTNFGLYMNTGYPGINSHKKFPTFPYVCLPTDIRCLAYNYGYNAAKYAIDYTALHNIHTNVWWLDVETENSWTDNPIENRAALQGMVGAIRHYTFFATVGYYSYPGQWDQITAGWRNKFPAWVATGSLTAQPAIDACKAHGFTGGPVWFAQYTAGLDHNYACRPELPGLLRNR